VPVRALLFDVFGTLVDWRSGVRGELRAMGDARGLDADWDAIADGWRNRYLPILQSVNAGERAWADLDVLHRATLDDVLGAHGVTGLDDEDRDRLVGAWHRLDAWPDAREGLQRLRERFVVATLSNAHVALLVDLARRNDLRFDAILSAQLRGLYKPHPDVYVRGAELLGVAPGEAMMVAAHPDDLLAARACGLRTAFVRRVLERGPGGLVASAPVGVDAVGDDLLEVAGALSGGGP
jgi:2-haloacid dehalogenase